MSENMFRAYRAEAIVEKFRIVKHGAADQSAVKASAAGDLLIGTSDGLDKAIGEFVDVSVAPIGEVELGGNVTRGQPLTSDANGRAVVAAPAGGANVRIIGFADASGVLNDVIRYVRSPGVMQG
ncbi:MAG: DUF2190 domain-containing protein [Methylibium sp.]